MVYEEAHVCEHGDINEMMFICGAQTTADGDFLPGSFTVFSRVTGPEEAMAIIMEKIVDDISELDIKHSEGVVAFLPIGSWQEFADIKEIDDSTKMAALSTAIVAGYLAIMTEAAETNPGLITIPWVPNSL